MLFEILLVFFILLSSISLLFLFYALRRINSLENILIEFQSIIEFSSNKLKKIDSTGHFESDDEVGFIFDEMKDLQFILDGIFEKEIGENSDSGEEKEKS